MKTITSLSLAALTIVTAVSAFSAPARASFTDFLVGAGAAAGATILIENAQKKDIENRYKPVSPQQEYYRGVQDGINGAKYDNPRDSADYDRGYRQGLRERQNQ